MRDCVICITVMVLVLSLPVFSKDRPTKATVPLSTDEISIYRALLEQYASDHSASLNVSSKTYPLDPDSHSGGTKFRECLRDIQLDNLSTTSMMYHNLTAEVLPGKNMRLVDPEKQAKVVRENDPGKTIGKGKSVDAAVKGAFATGLFSLSEIAFDKDHRHAVVSYSFWCGALCGHGYTLLFVKIGNEWRNTQRMCGGWIS